MTEAAAFPGKEHWPLGHLRLFIGGNLVDARTDGFKLSLKLYHRSGLRLGYQQSPAEAPNTLQPNLLSQDLAVSKMDSKKTSWEASTNSRWRKHQARPLMSIKTMQPTIAAPWLHGLKHDVRAACGWSLSLLALISIQGIGALFREPLAPFSLSWNAEMKPSSSTAPSEENCKLKTRPT